MRRKYTALILPILILATLLTSCIHQDIGIKINEDGSGAVVATVALEESFYEQLKTDGDDPFDGLPVFEYSSNGSNYVAYTESVSFSTLEEMETFLLNMNFEDKLGNAQNGDLGADESVESSDSSASNENSSTDENDSTIFETVNISKSGDYFKKTYAFKAKLKSLENSSTEEGALDFNINEIFKLTLSLEMPGKITDYKGGKLEDNKVTFNIVDLTAGQEIYAYSEVGIANLQVIIAGVLVVLLLIVFIFVGLGSRKGRKYGTVK